MFAKMTSGRFTFFAAVALSCAALANASCFVDPVDGVVTADQITTKMTEQNIDTTSMPQSAFSGCTSLVHVALPATVTSLGGYTFNGCTSLQTVDLPATLTSMGGRTFMGCTSLNTVIFPATLASIGQATFHGCTSLVTANLPATLTSMGGSMYYGCTSLETIILPAALTSMGGYTFQGCTSLTTVGLPATLTNMGDYTFKQCTSLATVCGATSLSHSIPANTFQGTCGPGACTEWSSGLTTMMTTACPTTSSPPLCSLTCGVENEMVKVTHDTTSSHTQHRCYLSDSNDLDSCICSCCDGASNDCDEDSNWEF